MDKPIFCPVPDVVYYECIYIQRESTLELIIDHIVNAFYPFHYLFRTLA